MQPACIDVARMHRDGLHASSKTILAHTHFHSAHIDLAKNGSAPLSSSRRLGGCCRGHPLGHAPSRLCLEPGRSHNKLHRCSRHQFTERRAQIEKSCGMHNHSAHASATPCSHPKKAEHGDCRQPARPLPSHQSRLPAPHAIAAACITCCCTRH